MQQKPLPVRSEVSSQRSSERSVQFSSGLSVMRIAQPFLTLYDRPLLPSMSWTVLYLRSCSRSSIRIRKMVANDWLAPAYLYLPSSAASSFPGPELWHEGPMIKPMPWNGR